MKEPSNSSEAAAAGGFAIVAMIVCCAIPLLAGATSLAVTGVVFGSTIAVIGAAALGVFIVARARRRVRTGEECCEPGSVTEVQPAKPMTTRPDQHA